MKQKSEILELHAFEVRGSLSIFRNSDGMQIFFGWNAFNLYGCVLSAVLFPSKSTDPTSGFPGQSTVPEFNYGFVYIAHPRAVTQLTWRKTSKYMPK